LRPPAALVAALLTMGCSDPSENLSPTPFGEWSTDRGHRLIVRPNGTYEICRNNTCSPGSYERGGLSSLTVFLRDFINKPEVDDVRLLLRECTTMGLSEETRSHGGVVSANDLVFSTVQDTLSGSNRASGVSQVIFSFETGSSLVFSKTADIRDQAADEELGRIRDQISKVPPPST